MSFLGNLFGQHKKEPQAEAPQHEQPAQAADGRKFKFQILTDEQAHFTDISYYTGLKVGHAWVRMITPEQSVTSWGFWPADGHKVNPLMPWKSIAGQVRSPDDTHSPTGMHTYEIDAEAAQRMETAAARRAASPGEYNLFHRNCVNFAHDMCDAAGVSAPSLSTLGIANPNALQAGIEKLNQQKGEDAMERPLPDSKFATPNA